MYPGHKAVHVRVDGGDATQHRLALALRLRLRLGWLCLLLLLLLLLRADLLPLRRRLRHWMRLDGHAVHHWSTAAGRRLHGIDNRAVRAMRTRSPLTMRTTTPHFRRTNANMTVHTGLDRLNVLLGACVLFRLLPFAELASTSTLRAAWRSIQTRCL